MIPPRYSWLAALLLFPLANTAAAGEAYYLLVFGSQLPGLNRPAHTHSFATFVRATGLGEGCAAPQIQAWTISWLPRTLDIEVYRLRPECGVNLDLHGTLRWAFDDGQRVSMWGPYQIQKDLFDRALAQVAFLQSGAVCYKAVDTGYSTERVCNCIHAIADVALDSPRLHVGVPGWGESASYFVTLDLAPWIIQPRQTHDWLLPRLCLTNYPLVRRDLEHNPTRGPVLRTLQTAARLSLRLGPGD